jgi:peptidoglycan/LPS O-acetylase OafA/YrhL
MKNDIDIGVSVYLDLLRFLAAFAVVMSHVWRLVFPHFPLPWPGHAAVIVFFVISGFVIAFATDHPGGSARAYAVHRAVRILSVTVPALMLSVCIAPVAGTNQIPLAGPIPFPDGEFLHAIWINLVFLGESSWFGRVLPPFNPPYWSLSYEVWYYAIFGAWLFARPRWRFAMALFVTVLAGLKIALLFPVWLLGVIAYRTRPTLAHRTALGLFIFTTILGLAFYWFDMSVQIRTHMQYAIPSFMRSLHGSDQFVGDYVLGVIVAIHFIAAGSMAPYLGGLVRLRRPIRYLASLTLSIYLLHMPLTVFIWNGLGVRSVSAYALLLVTGILIVGSLSERKNKLVRFWVEGKVGSARTPQT